MIERIEGEVLETGGEHLLIGIGGVGIRVHVPRSVCSRVEAGSVVRLSTRLVVRDGEPRLFGFAETIERDCFDSLLAVSGVGTRIALAILSFLGQASLVLAVEGGATDPLTTVPGVGRKLANRIILELKGRLPAVDSVPGGGIEVAMEGSDGDAVRALTSLGYPAVEAREAVRRILGEAAGETPPLDELVRASLIDLNRARR